MPFCFKGIFILLFLSCIPFTSFGQLKIIDSLTKKRLALENNAFFKPDTSYVALLDAIADKYLEINLDSLYYYTNKIRTHSTALKYPKGLANALIKKSWYANRNGKTSEAIEYLNQALSIAKKNNLIATQLHILGYIGTTNNDLGNVTKSMEAYKEAIEIANKVGYIGRLAILKENLAILYLNNSDFATSLEILKEVELLNEQLGNEISSSKTYSNLAEVYLYLNDSENALSYINKAISTFEKHEILEWLAFSYNIKGNIHQNNTNFEKAKYWYYKSLKIHEQIDDPRYKLDLLNAIANNYHKHKNYDEAKSYALQALKIATKLDVLNGKITAQKTLYQIYKETNLPTKALAYLEQYKLLADSVMRLANINSLEISKTKLSFEKKQKEISLENQKKRFQNNIIVYLILMALIGVLFAYYFSKKQFKKRKILIEQLQKSNATKEKLFAILAHDLKAPLNALSSILDLLNNNTLSSKEFYSYTANIKKDVDAMSLTLQNLLTWGHKQIKGSRKISSKTDLNTLVQENCNLFNESANLKDITLLNKTLPNTFIWANSDQINLILRNLINNALKFTSKHGEIGVSASKTNDFITVAVKDNGVGMITAVQEKLFTVENDTNSTVGTENEKGSGLGLFLCKEMVENNGGKIWVESSKGIGTTFYFTIPANNMKS